MDPSSIALRGLQQAEIQLDTTAAAVGRADGKSSPGSNGDVVDLSSAMVALISAQTSYQANLATLKTADQMVQNLVNLVA